MFGEFEVDVYSAALGCNLGLNLRVKVKKVGVDKPCPLRRTLKMTFLRSDRGVT